MVEIERACSRKFGCRFFKKVLSMVIVALGGLLEGCPQPAQEGILFWIRIDLILNIQNRIGCIFK